MRLLVLSAVALFAAGCDDADADAPVEADGGGAGDAGGALTCDQPQLDFPTCPTPDTLPFDAPAVGFASPENETIASPGQAWSYENRDLYGPPDIAQGFVGRFARGAALAPRGLAGEPVSLWAWNHAGRWEQLDAATTDERGDYAFHLDGESPWGVGEHVAYAVFGADGTCAPHGVFLWPRGTQVVIADIDGTLTLSDAELTRQIGDPSYTPESNTGSAELMQAWAARGYKTMYLTARPHTLRLQTRAWLELMEIPYGPVITADGLVFGGTAREYKRDAIRQVVEEYGWELVAAYGNATSDIEAYEEAGHPKDRTFIIGENAGEAGTVAVPGQDWTPHIEAYVAAQPVANQPPELEQTPFCR